MAEDYRNKFKKHYGIEFGNEFHVHHIDLDHTNNDIKNLMILPKKLHNLYHFLLGTRDGGKLQRTINAKIHSYIVNGDRYELENEKKLIEVLMECNKWYDYMLYLNGEMPNIHDLEVY